MAQQLVRTVSSLGSAVTGAFVPAAEATVGALTGASSRNITSSSGSLPSSSGSQLSSSRSQPTSRTGYTASADILARQAELNARRLGTIEFGSSESLAEREEREEALNQWTYENDLSDESKIQLEIREFLETLDKEYIPISSRRTSVVVDKFGQGRRFFHTSVKDTATISALRWKTKLRDLCEEIFGKKSRGKATEYVVSVDYQIKITADATKTYVTLKKEYEKNPTPDAKQKMLDAEKVSTTERNKLIEFAKRALDPTSQDYIQDEFQQITNKKTQKTIQKNIGKLVRDEIRSTLSAGFILLEHLKSPDPLIQTVLKTDDITNISTMIQAANNYMGKGYSMRTGIHVLNTRIIDQGKELKDNLQSLVNALKNDPSLKKKPTTGYLRLNEFKMLVRYTHGVGMRISGDKHGEHSYELKESRDGIVDTIRQRFKSAKNQSGRDAVANELGQIFTDEFIECLILATNNPFSNGFLLSEAKNKKMEQLTKSWRGKVKEYLDTNPSANKTDEKIFKNLWIDHLKGEFTPDEAGKMFDLRNNFAKRFTDSVKDCHTKLTGKDLTTDQTKFLGEVSTLFQNIVKGTHSPVGGGWFNWLYTSSPSTKDIIVEALYNVFMSYLYTPLPGQLTCMTSTNDPMNTNLQNNDPENTNNSQKKTSRVYVMGFPVNIPIVSNVVFLKTPKPNDYKLMKVCPLTLDDTTQIQSMQTLLKFILELDANDYNEDKDIDLSNTIENIDSANVLEKVKKGEENIEQGALLLEKAALLKELGMSNSNSNTYPIEYLRKLQRAKQNKNSSTNDPLMSPNSGNQSNTPNDPQIILPPRFNGNDPGMPEPNRRGIARNYSRTPIRRPAEGFARAIVDARIPKGPNDPQPLGTGGRRTQKRRHRKGKKRSTKRR